MKMMKRCLVFCLLVGLLLMLAMPAYAAEKMDYGALFAGVEEKGWKPLNDALVEDPVAFLEALAFQSKDVQQLVINTMTYDSPVDRQVLLFLIDWAKEGRELTESEKSMLAAFRYAIEYRYHSFQRAYKTGDELVKIMQEAPQSDGYYSEHLGGEYAEAIKGDTIGFVRALAAQDAEVKRCVPRLLMIEALWEMGNVLTDLLNGIDRTILTEDESAVVDDLLEIGLKETKAPVMAVGPDPDELAAYLKRKEHAVENPQVTVPVTTQPQATEPDPGKEPVSESGISGWWLLLAPVCAGLGFYLGKRSKKEA